MKNKELEKQINDMIYVLTNTMEQITGCETANESLVVEINNLKTQLELVEQERDSLAERCDKLNDIIKDLRSQTEAPKIETQEDVENPYRKLSDTSKSTMEAMRREFGRTEVDIKHPRVKTLVWETKNNKPAFTATLRTLSERYMTNGTPLVTLVTQLHANRNEIVTFKFNF